jgi:hypothetical protein
MGHGRTALCPLSQIVFLRVTGPSRSHKDLLRERRFGVLTRGDNVNLPEEGVPRAAAPAPGNLILPNLSPRMGIWQTGAGLPFACICGAIVAAHY